MENVSAHLDLTIELDSEPIAGRVGAPGGEPRAFNGWIELVEVIETVRRGRNGSGASSNARSSSGR